MLWTRHPGRLVYSLVLQRAAGPRTKTSHHIYSHQLHLHVSSSSLHSGTLEAYMNIVVVMENLPLHARLPAGSQFRTGRKNLALELAKRSQT